MKCCVSIPNNVDKKDCDVINIFIFFLQKHIPLSDDVLIKFLNSREGGMTTGSRRNGSELRILLSKRLLIDVLRTLCHEWVHEYQFQKMGLLNGYEVQDIGGFEENMANTTTGAIMKLFQKNYPELETILYSEN